MPQSLSKVTIHAVFSTKNRTPWLNETLQPGLFAYLAGILKHSGNHPVIVGGHTDHIHMLFGQSKTVTLAKTIEAVKVSSSIWIKEQNPQLQDFAWQKGYGAFSISSSDSAAAVGYIANQSMHHHKISFQDELRVLLNEHDIDFDERYLWD